MNKVFMTYVMALLTIAGVSAQEWSRTLATGLPGKEITHDVNGTQVTQYRAESGLIKNAGATGVRYTVVQTTATGTYGGGPFFAMGEMIVLDAAGDTINYTVISNADHNSGGAGTDGAGLPALNDGNFNNFFHSSWGGTEPGGLHYLELTFAQSVDEFQLVWYTRPNQHVNRPQVVGLTNPGVEFTEDMLFAEYGFELGEKVTTDAELAAGGTFAFYVEAPADLSDYGDYTSNGNTFIALSGYTTGSNPEASVQTMVQLIPGTEDGQFVIYQPVYGSYYGNPDRWTDGFNGKNGWLRAYSEGWTLGQFDITAVAGGEFEITTEITRQYVDGAWVDFDEPMTVYVGYDPRGNLKIFPENVKQGLEQGDYTLGFGLPVDFGFEIYKTAANSEMVPDKTTAQMCGEVLAKEIKTANEMKTKYAEYADEEAIGDLEDAIADAEGIVADGDLAAAFEYKSELQLAIAAYVGLKIDYYDALYEELEELVENNMAEFPYKQEDTGKYTQASAEMLNTILNLFGACDEALDAGAYSTLESLYAQFEALFVQIESTKLHFSTFPEIVKEISNTNFPYADYPNNAVWRQELVLAEKTKGIRLTALSVYIGSAGGGGLYGGYPMLALGEIKLYDANGTEVTLTEDNVRASHTETNEGFESTAARLVDGVITGAGSYFHSPWSGTAPSEYVYIELTFPEAMDNFTFEVYSRDKSTTQGNVSLFPYKVAITEAGVAYDPLLFTENPYKVTIGEKVSSVEEITADGYYVIKGLLNTQSVDVKDEEGNVSASEPSGKASFYHGVSRFHSEAAAVRAPGVYRFVPNADGTFKALSLGLARYWPSTTETGFVDGATTYEAAKAANLNIVPSRNAEGAFVMYEKIEGLTTEVEAEAGESTVYNTPYVVFMGWYSGLATRPVTDPQPYRDDNHEIVDAQGDALCFNKANGEGEWEIYKVSIENPDFFYLTNMVGAFDELGLKVGTNPGEVSNLGNLEGVLAAAQAVIADSVYADAPAAAAALANEIAAVTSLEKNPVIEGIYQIVSASTEFMNKQGVEKALYAHVDEDGNATFGWTTLVENDNRFYFALEKSPYAEDFLAEELVTEDEAGKLYNIRAIATYEPETAYYIGETDGKTVQIDLFADATSDYLVLNATGSAFNLSLVGKHDAGFSLHANQHGSGSGQSGNIVYWYGEATMSQWYLRAVDELDIETKPEDLEYKTAKEDLLAASTRLLEFIEGLSGNIISDARTYANDVVSKTENDFYTIKQLKENLSVINEMYDSIINSTVVFATENSYFNMAYGNKTVPFEMNNGITNFSAFQCNIYLPAGFSIATNKEGDYDITLNRERVSSNHTITAEKQNDGSYLIACYSSNNALIRKESGVLFYATIEIDETVTQGEHQIVSDKFIFSTPEPKEVTVNNINSSISLYMPADVNQDNIVDTADIHAAVYAISDADYNWKYPYLQTTDMNSDGEVSILDIVAVADVAQNGYVKREMKTQQADGSIIFEFEKDRFNDSSVIYFPLSIKSNRVVTALQCDLYLTNAVLIPPYIELAGSAADTHICEVTALSDRGQRVIIFSENNEAMSENFITIAIRRTALGQQPSIVLKNLRLCTTDFNEFIFNDIKMDINIYKSGDANGDGDIKISDVVMTVNALLGNVAENFMFSAADMNKDGEITIADVVSIVNALLRASESANASMSRAASYVPEEHGDALYVCNGTVKENETRMAVKLENSSTYTAIQFDMDLPEGVSIEEISMKNGKHTVSYNKNRVVAYSLTNDAFDDMEEIMNITFHVEDGIECAQINFEEIYVMTTDFTEKRLKASGATIDGSTGIADVNDSRTRIYAEDNNIVIESTNNGIAEIVSANGIILHSEITAGKNHIAIKHKGLYIIKVGDSISKIIF